MKFFGIAGKVYEVAATNAGNADIAIEFHGTDGQTFLKRRDIGSEGEDESLDTDPMPEDGICHVMLSDVAEAAEGESGYELTVRQPGGPVLSAFEGSVRDAFSENPIGDTMIRTTQNFTALSESGDGAFVMYHAPLAESDTYSLKADAVTLTARVPGYDIFRRLAFMLGDAIRVLSDAGDTPGNLRAAREDTVQASDLAEWDGKIALLPAIPGDISSDRSADLADLLIALRVLSGTDAGADVRPHYATSGADVNGDGQIGPEELIYLLKTISNEG